jgi:hypothetical protein
MNDTQLETLDQIRQFLEGTEAISFQIESKDATLHGQMASVLRSYHWRIKQLKFLHHRCQPWRANTRAGSPRKA